MRAIIRRLRAICPCGHPARDHDRFGFCETCQSSCPGR